MTRVEAYRQDAEYAFGELLTALDGLTEQQAWDVLPAAEDDYLHTDGSIQGVVLHMASGKWVYGRIGFRNTEIRWRDAADQIASFEPTWAGALDYLKRGQEYWLACWASLVEEEMDQVIPTNFSTDRTAAQMIQMMNHHDSYHAGQIALLRYSTQPSAGPPPSYAEDIRKYCRESKYW